MRVTGSSPLARGLLGLLQDPGDAVGIIPARAGFTRQYSACFSAAPDHPRSRGVYPGCALLVSDTAGSSPLARGLRADIRLEQFRDRIIPARAGFTPGRWR